MTVKYTNEQLIQALREHPALGFSRWQRCRIKPGSDLIVHRFGSWNHARELAGLPQRHGRPSKLTDEEKARRLQITREAMANPCIEAGRETLKQYPLEYLKLTDGWAEKTWKKMTGREEIPR